MLHTALPLARAHRQTSHSAKELTTSLSYMTVLAHPALHYFVCSRMEELSTSTEGAKHTFSDLM